MILAEKRLNQSILRNQILKELGFLLENFKKLNEIDQDFFSMSPGESTADFEKRQEKYRQGQEHLLNTVSDTVSNFLSNTGKNFYEAWKELKSGVRDPSLFAKSSNLAYQDMKILAKKDPVSFVCWVLDAISLFDPTGTADIIQGALLISQGVSENSGLGIFFGVICLIAGFMTASAFLATAGTGGAAAPVLVLAKASGIGLKQLTTKSVRKISEILSRGGDFMINIIRKSPGFDKKAASEVEKIIINSKKMPPPKEGETAAELIENLTGMKPTDSITSPLDAAGKAKIVKAAQEIKNGGIQVLGFSASTSATAMQGSDITKRQRAEETIRNNWCGIDFENMSVCNDIVTFGKEFQHRSKTNSSENLMDFEQAFQRALEGKEIFGIDEWDPRNPKNWESEDRQMSIMPGFIKDPDIATGRKKYQEDPDKPIGAGEPDKPIIIKRDISKGKKVSKNKNRV